jgi:hypothetical protein
LRSGIRDGRVGDAFDVAVLQEADVQFALGAERHRGRLVAAKSEARGDGRYARNGTERAEYGLELDHPHAGSAGISGLPFGVIPNRGIGARGAVLSDLSHRAPDQAGPPADRPTGITVELQIAGVEWIVIRRIDGNVMPEALGLVANPELVPDDHRAGRSMRGQGIARRDTGSSYEIRGYLGSSSR